MKTFHFLVAIISVFFCTGLEAKTNSTRIVGGRPTNIQKIKYLVNLRLKGRFVCGGSLINRRFVLTAAHCVVNVRPAQLRIQGGSSMLSNRGIIRQVQKIIIAPRYSTKTLSMDVAVIKLKAPMTGRYTKPIRLCTHKLRPRMPVRISGWGLTNENNVNPSNRVRTTIVRMISRSSCKRKYPGAIKQSMICAELKGLRDSCSGDSGGPLVHNNELCGIVSWGEGCAGKNRPGVYTSVNAVRAFIKRALRQ